MEKPKIRFKEYQEDWEQRKLSELTTMHARIGWQNLRTSEFLNNGDYMLITGTDFNDGAINYSTCHYVEKERYDQDKNIQIHNGSILITKDGTLGKVAYVQGLTMPATLNAGVFNVEIKDENLADEKYLFQYLKAPFLMDYVSKKATGGTIKHLNQSILVDFPVAMPKKEEQTKIGNYFQQLDHLITLHQRKCEEMKTLKKYMLQKMFPQNGQSVPQIRFSGFTEDWEQRKLDDVVEFLDTMRKPLEGAKRISGPYPYYGASGIVDYVDGYLFDEELILLSEDGANITDRNYPVCFLASGKYWVNNHAHVLRTKQGNENNFICNSLERKDYTQYNTGMAMPKLNKETCKKIPILCPGFEEQKKIGDYFRSLDNLITLHQQKCDELRNIKKFMLQNMFI